MIRGVVSQIKALQEDTGPTPYLDQFETLLAGAKEFKGVNPNSDAAKFGNAEICMLGEKYGQRDESYIDPTETLQEWSPCYSDFTVFS